VFDWQADSDAYPNQKPIKSPWSGLPPQPAAAHVLDVPLHMWFEQRGMLYSPDVKEDDIWWEPGHTYRNDIGEVIVYRKCPSDPNRTMAMNAISRDGDMQTAYHGLPTYAVGNAARNQFSASDNKERGHESLDGSYGAYVTPVETTAWGYAIAHLLFEDRDLPPGKQCWVRFMFQVQVRISRKCGGKKDKNNPNNIQWVFPENMLR